MATKRMFDKAIVETDAFLDLSMPAKALYFLLGMEADDEGFVSPKRVMRIYGGNDDDLRILIFKRFVISFESGVVVITDWQKNNWLDSRRLKKTEYQKERLLLGLDNGKYVLLSESLADAKPEEYRGVEKRGEEREETPALPEPKKPKAVPLHKSVEYLRNVPAEDVEEFIYNFKCGEQGVKEKAAALLDYCEATGKRYSNYKAFLRNALRKDFGVKTPEQRERDKELLERVKATHNRISVGTVPREPVREPTPEEAKQNLEKLRLLKARSGIGKFSKV